MKMRKLMTSALLSMALLGAGAALPQAHASAHRIHHVHRSRPVIIVKKAKLSQKQARQQNRGKIQKNVKEAANHDHNRNWFVDGLNKRQLRARGWIVNHESGGRWNVVSYGHVCVGYFQLSPGYLGRKNGRVNLNHQHQVKVADHYAQNRYGGWTHAKSFWQAHHWY